MADRRSYNAVLRGLKRQGLTHTQARAAWTSLKERLGKSPTAADLKAHPRITAQEIKKAPARERALRAAQTRAAKKAAAAPPAKPSRPKGKGAGAGGAGAGGIDYAIPPERFREIEAEWDDYDTEDWDGDIYGE